MGRNQAGPGSTFFFFNVGFLEDRRLGKRPPAILLLGFMVSLCPVLTGCCFHSQLLSLAIVRMGKRVFY